MNIDSFLSLSRSSRPRLLREIPVHVRNRPLSETHRREHRHDSRQSHIFHHEMQYSSLDYLKTYHVSRLKIPQVMMNAAMQDPGDAAMVRAIVGIARELKIEVVAQGVENKGQQALLTAAASTTMVQGFYYSEPVPAAQAAALLSQRLIEPRMMHHADAVRVAE